jgi:hypothetical protein
VKRRSPLPAAPTAALPTHRDAVVAAIARRILGLETLESRHQDRLDFHDIGVASLRDALAAAFEAGRVAAKTAGHQPTLVDGDLVVTTPLPSAGMSAWISGRIQGFRFEAKVYPEHALQPAFEIKTSRISKLELRRLDTGTVAFAWDRGLDQPADDAEAQAAVDALAARLANLIYGPVDG